MGRRLNDYEQLGLEPSASPDEIASAFRALALESHPDRGGDAARMIELTEIRDRLLGPAFTSPGVYIPVTDNRTARVSRNEFDDVRLHFYLVPLVLVPALVLALFVLLVW